MSGFVVNYCYVLLIEGTKYIALLSIIISGCPFYFNNILTGITGDWQ